MMDVLKGALEVACILLAVLGPVAFLLLLSSEN